MADATKTTGTKKRSKSAKAGLKMPASHARRCIDKYKRKGQRVQRGVDVYVTSVAEFLTKEVIEAAELQCTQTRKSKRHTYEDTCVGLRSDSELHRFFSTVRIYVGVPYEHTGAMMKISEERKKDIEKKVANKAKRAAACKAATASEPEVA